MDKKRAEIIEELKKFKKKNHLEKIIFFGSRIKGRYHKYSDVDLLIVSPRFNKLKSFKRSPTIRLNWGLEFPVDMLCYTPKEFREQKNQPTIVREAIRTGIEIK